MISLILNTMPKLLTKWQHGVNTFCCSAFVYFMMLVRSEFHYLSLPPGCMQTQLDPLNFYKCHNLSTWFSTFNFVTNSQS